ncbi:unnamed protein product, partial [marine sediment metagenome]
MSSPAMGLASMLIESENGLDLILGVDLFTGSEPAKPDFCVTLMNTPGQPPVFGGEGYFRPGVQLRVRDLEVDTGWAKIKEYYDILNDRAGDFSGGYRYIGIWAQGDIMFSHKDEKNRYIHVA